MYAPYTLGSQLLARGDQLDSLVRSRNLQSVLDSDITLWNKITCWELKNGHHTAIEILEPLSLIIEVHEDFLELHILARKGPSGPGDEWAQIMAVHAHMALVGSGFGFTATRPHESIQRLKFRRGVRFELFCIYHL